ncbi:MAG TPA: hypothetical protein PLI50_06175 [bacterium]|nr:hypothetical protein [bacterium]
MRFFQEKIYQFTNCGNGADPLWCMGSSCIAADNDRIFVSGWDTIPGIPLLNCARWTLFQKKARGWEIVRQDTEKTREPSPICVLEDGKLFLSANAFMLEPEAIKGVCLPMVYQFESPDYSKQAKKIIPHFSEPVVFNEHSYRNFSADRENSELLLFHNRDYDRAYWSLMDKDGRCISCDKLYWPWGYDYPVPHRIRLCYSNIQLKNRAAYVFGTSDIPEPNPEWRKYKREITGRMWDFDFRRVFFSFTPDITKEPFTYWVEISGREKTAGNAWNCDLFVDDNGITHVLWTEKSCDERLKQKFFPDEPLIYSLKYARLKKQKILDQKEIFSFQEGTDFPSGIEKMNLCRGKFHITENGKIFIFGLISGIDNNKKTIAENWLIEIDSTGNIKSKEIVNFQEPFTFIHNAGMRNGTKPSDTLHIYGYTTKANNEMWYGCIEC